MCYAVYFFVVTFHVFHQQFDDICGIDIANLKYLFDILHLYCEYRVVYSIRISYIIQEGDTFFASIHEVLRILLHLLSNRGAYLRFEILLFSFLLVLKGAHILFLYVIRLIFFGGLLKKFFHNLDFFLPFSIQIMLFYDFRKEEHRYEIPTFFYVMLRSERAPVYMS